MATHGSLRSDAYDPDSVYDQEIEVLVPGFGNYSNDPSAFQTKRVRLVDPEALREVLRAQHKINQASTFAFAASDSDDVYENMIHKDGVLYAANPGDPASPTAVLTVASSNYFSTIIVSGSSNVVADSAGDSLTLVAGYATGITTDATADSVTVAWDHTGISGYSASGNFYLKLISGTPTWVAVGSC